MELLDSTLAHQTIRVLWTAIVPLFAVPLVGFVVALVQGMMGTREDSVTYAARIGAAVGVVALFGAAIWKGFQELAVYALR